MNTLHLIIQELASWRSILDIAIITGGLYLLCRTLARLGTLKIVAGTLVGFLFLILASMLRLEGVGRLFENVSHAARLDVRHS